MIREKIEVDRVEKEEAVKQGRLHPTELDKIPNIPFIEDLVQVCNCFHSLFHVYRNKQFLAQ